MNFCNGLTGSNLQALEIFNIFYLDARFRAAEFIINEFLLVTFVTRFVINKFTYR